VILPDIAQLWFHPAEMDTIRTAETGGRGMLEDEFDWGFVEASGSTLGLAVMGRAFCCGWAAPLWRGILGEGRGASMAFLSGAFVPLERLRHSTAAIHNSSTSSGLAHYIKMNR